MAPSEARAEDLMARRRTGSTEGAVVEVARSMRDAMEDSAAAEEEEGFEFGSASAGAADQLEEATGRGIEAIGGERRGVRVRGCVLRAARSQRMAELDLAH